MVFMGDNFRGNKMKRAQILSFKYHSPQGSFKKWLILGLEQKKDKMCLEHLYQRARKCLRKKVDTTSGQLSAVSDSELGLFTTRDIIWITAKLE